MWKNVSGTHKIKFKSHCPQDFFEGFIMSLHLKWIFFNLEVHPSNRNNDRRFIYHFILLEAESPMSIKGRKLKDSLAQWRKLDKENDQTNKTKKTLATNCFWRTSQYFHSGGDSIRSSLLNCSSLFNCLLRQKGEKEMFFFTGNELGNFNFC